MLHNERLANPRDPHTIALKVLTNQKKKTDETLEQIAKKEWFAGIYEENGVPVLPADNLLATAKEGGRKRRLGKQVECGVFCEQKSFPIEYDGPKTVEGLWKDGRFFDYRSVAVNQRRTMRARPRFDEWAVVASFCYDPEQISEQELIDCLTHAGLSVGLCEKRPQFGRFVVTILSDSDVAEAAQ